MTLRFRLALGAAILAVVSSLSVASISYLSTQKRLQEDIDQSITNVLQRFQDPDQNLVNAFCAQGSGLGDRADDVDAALLGGAPGVTLQCLNSSGDALATIGPTVSVKFATCTDDSAQISPPTMVGRDDHQYAVASLRTPAGFCVASARDLDETHETLASIRNRSAFVGIVVTLLGTVGGLIAARRATAPIVRLTDTVEKITSTNDLNVELGAESQSEVGRLSAAFLTMINTLKHAQTQQQQLIRNAEHELRTPLTSIHTNVSTLRRYRDLDIATQEQILDEVMSELGELTSLVDEVVLLGGGDRDSGSLEPISLHATVQSVVLRWTQRSGRLIEVTKSDLPDVISGRTGEVARAVSNLLDNAIKFSPEGSSVDVKVDGQLVSVRDHGAGINEADIAKVYDRFFRSVDARSLPGSGLGLSIVAQVAASHGADLAVRNVHDGGAEFSITFPKIV